MHKQLTWFGLACVWAGWPMAPSLLENLMYRILPPASITWAPASSPSSTTQPHTPRPQPKFNLDRAWILDTGLTKCEPPYQNIFNISFRQIKMFTGKYLSGCLLILGK